MTKIVAKPNDSSFTQTSFHRYQGRRKVIGGSTEERAELEKGAGSQL
jgi:hypothetical protein